MGDELKAVDFDEARIEQVRADARALIEREGLSKAKAAVDIGIGASTLPAFLSGNYNGSNNQVAMQVQRWLTARMAQAATAAKQAAGPGYVNTKTAATFCALLEHAQYAPDLGVIVGEPGLGKTVTARAYSRTAHNVWMITCQPATGSPSMVVSELADTLNLAAPGSSAPRLCKLIVRKLSGLSALLIIDEAQHLTSTALDQLRTFHDLANCGVVVMGNRSILRNLEGGRNRSPDFAQLYSRVGQRIDRKRAASEDIEAILDAWQIDDDSVRRIGRAVARKPGALRAMDKVLRQAHLRARADGTPVTERHMVASAVQLGDEKPLELDA